MKTARASVGMADYTSHYFSQHVSPCQRRRDSGFPKTFAADGGARPIPGALRFVSLALHILPLCAEGTAGTFQRGMFSNSTAIRKRIAQQLVASLRGTFMHDAARRTLQQAWMNSRNQTTIASVTKHRQHQFLHPTISEWNAGAVWATEILRRKKARLRILGRRLPRAENARSRLLSASTC
jgi:hypothetical protein